ncbi:MAG: hypothetical protein WAK51_05310 [Opitutaceae bacterium]|jgi:hypothetical protein
MLEIVANRTGPAAVARPAGSGPRGTATRRTALVLPRAPLLGTALGMAPVGMALRATLGLALALSLRTALARVRGAPRRGTLLGTARALGGGRLRLLGWGYRFTKPGNELA